MNDSIQMMAELAFTSMQSGDFNNAEEIFHSLAKTSPDDAISSIGLASISLANGDVQGAIKEIEANGLDKTVNSHEAQKLLLIAAMLAGDNEKSEQVHQHFITNNICPGHEADQEKHLQDAQTFFRA